MGKAIIYTALTLGIALVSFLWSALGRPLIWSAPAAGLLAALIAAPIVFRKDFQFVGLPGFFELGCAAIALGATVYGGQVANELWLWIPAIILLFASVRTSLVTLKAYQRPMSLKIMVGVPLVVLVGLNVYLGVRHSEWVGKTSTALVKQWFPEATSPPVRTPPGQAPVTPKPPPAPPAVKVDPGAPFATVAGHPLTREVVQYQMFIDQVIAQRSDRNDAVAALLQAYTARVILEKNFKAFDPEMLKDENEWLLNRTSDTKLVNRIRNQQADLFLDVYVGANGFYRRKLKEIFDKTKKEELKRRGAEVLKEIQAVDGVERPGPKVDGVLKQECRYSNAKGDFIAKFDVEAAPKEKPDARDPWPAKLAKLAVNMTLPEVIWGDQNALIVRRIPDDFQGRAIYETYRVVEDGLFSAWFKRQARDLVIEIPDPQLRAVMLELAKDVTHIIKVK